MNTTKGYANFAFFAQRSTGFILTSTGHFPLRHPGFFGRDTSNQPKSVFDTDGHPLFVVEAGENVGYLTSEHQVSLALEAADPLLEVLGTSLYERDLCTGIETYTVHARSLVDDGTLKFVDEEFDITVIPEEDFEGKFAIVWQDFTHRTVIGTYSTSFPGGVASVVLLLPLS